MAHGDRHWTVLSERRVLETPIFSLMDRENEGPAGRRGRFVVLDAPDWAVTVPVLERDGRRFLVTVLQYRHGSDEVSAEFPGGVVERGEDPAEAARRELLEETGYRAARIELIGECSPNPAFMANRFRVYLGTDLELVGGQSLDEHELVDVHVLPEAEVLAAMGRPPYVHALMVAAAFYYRAWREASG